jgi:tRNA-splicing ligase RtcB (3'-phosphate/5'-hydroxy nucleic acid ligase)
MIEFTTDSGTRVKVWVNSPAEIESHTRAQINEMGRLRFIHDHIAIMPDVHLGMGAVIGSVLPAKDAVSPNIVGVDIGCGISAYDTGITKTAFTERIAEQDMDERSFWSLWDLETVRDVPAGFKSHKRRQSWDGLDVSLRARSLRPLMAEKATYQLGTLGGGNHFVEAQTDERGHLWFMVHSGSRHTGLRIANYYNEAAKKLLGRTKTPYPRNLAYLPKSHDLFHDYMHDMGWAVSFALENRWRMLEQAVGNFMALAEIDSPAGAPVRRDGINIHHNFARAERHFGEDVIVHRKGATSASDGEIGIIPGSMGTNSYIVRGKGSADSFASCSHGAGRAMSRTAARKTIAQDDFERALAHTFTRAARGYIDEAPQSYKDVDEVVRRQTDLVDTVHVLRPIITLKGDSKARDD